MRRISAALLAGLALSSTGAAQEPAIDAVLQRAGRYVAEYQQRLAGIVSEEFYRQNVVSTSRPGRLSSRQYRELRSDLLLVKPGTDESWLQFRDVFEVDGKPIRDRDERLYKLFITAKPDRRQQAETIQGESARYNIGPVQRTINIPILALLFFEERNQPALEYKRVKSDNAKRFATLAVPEQVWAIEFREVTAETMVRGAQGRGVPSHGRVWLDSVTGRILRTEHISEDTSVRALIDVTYKAEAGLDLLVPSEMRENYLVRRSEVRIDGRATYSKFRQFTVTTSEKPKSQ
jgi:hypothetical protein